jgi:hypothetical protein
MELIFLHFTFSNVDSGLQLNLKKCHILYHNTFFPERMAYKLLLRFQMLRKGRTWSEKFVLISVGPCTGKILNFSSLPYWSLQ